MELHYGVNGKDRKRLAEVVGEVIGEKPVFGGLPAFLYEVGYVKIFKGGKIVITERTDKQISEIIQAASKAGFTCEEEKVQTNLFNEEAPQSSPDIITISIPRWDKLTNSKLINLQRIIHAKQELFCKAFGCEKAELIVYSDRVEFPWFERTGKENEEKIYTYFCNRLRDLAIKLKWVNQAKEVDDPNDKYAFRCLLLRMGYVGSRYKDARKFLLKNLSGSTAFRHGKEAAHEITKSEDN